MFVVFGLLKMSFWVPKKKRSAIIFGKPTRVHKMQGFREMDKKELINSSIFNFPCNNRTDKIFLAQPKINPRSLKKAKLKL